MKTKDRILKVAEEEFSRLGYDSVSMNDLVKKLDINKATVYYHFKDKKALYQEIIKDIMIETNESLHKIFDEKLSDINLSAALKFKLYINEVIKSIKARPSIVSLALREYANYGANVEKTILPYIEEEIELIKKLIEKLNLKDKYKNFDAYAIFSMIHGTIFNFYTMQMSTLPIGGQKELKLNSDKSLNYISDFIANIILDAICKEEEI